MEEDNKEQNNTTIRFRKEALEHMWSQHGRFTLNTLIPTYSWGYLIFACLILFSLLIWSIAGTISDYVQGEGLLLSGTEAISTVNAPPGVNQIKKIHVKDGDEVDVGTIIATMENPNLEAQIPILKEKHDFYQKKLQEYTTQSENEIQNRIKLTKEQNDILQKIIESESKNLNEIKELIQTQDYLREKRLIRNFDRRVVQQQLADSQRSLENANNQIIANEMALTSFKNDWKDRIRNVELEEKEALISLELQQEMLNSSGEVKSLIKGKVIHIDKKPGDFTKDGEGIATLSESADTENLRAVIYIPANLGKKVKPGMPALVSPTIVEIAEFGSIKGIVESISDYPVSPQEIQATLKNETIVRTLTQRDAPYKAVVKLSYKDNKLIWTSSNGPGFPITEGTFVKTTIHVKQQRPITLILPGLKSIMGLDK